MKYLEKYNTFITEGYDDLPIEYFTEKKKKLSDYKNYDNKKVIGNYTYLNFKENEDNWYIWGNVLVFDNSDGTEVANSSYGKEFKESKLKASVDVRSDKRRQGIASNIYEWIEALTKDKLHPDTPHSKSAQRLWNNPNRKFGIK